MLSKTLASRFYAARYKDLGKRFEHLVREGALNLTGGVEFQVYKLLPAKEDSAMAGAVQHIQGAQAPLPELQRFPLETQILCNYNDLEAYIHHGIIKFNLHELFTAEQLNKESFGKEACRQLAQKLEKQQEKQAEQVSLGSIAVEAEVQIINPSKRKLAKMKEAREQQKVRVVTPSGQPSAAIFPVAKGECAEGSSA